MMFFCYTMSEPRTDIYGYNARSELISSARTGGAPSLTTEHEYAYDPIGNRTSSSDIGTARTYTANSLNQYTGISDGVDTFAPQFDDDGNQTLIQTKTGTWSVTYNGENRPIQWSCVASNSSTPNSSTPSLILMSFDRMGRRVQYIETVGVVTNAHRTFTYDNYLQIADNIGNRYLWDPTEPIATRPLAFITSTFNAQPATHFYTHDGNKNVSELVDDSGVVTAHYEYAPFGGVELFSSGSLATTNPFRFSSEYVDDTLGLVYYNYRHYDPVTGRWMSRDPVDGQISSFTKYIFHIEIEEYPLVIKNFYSFVQNDAFSDFDVAGLMEKSLIYISQQSKYNFAEKIASKYYSDGIRTKSPNDFNPNDFIGPCDCIKNLTVIMHGSISRDDSVAVVKWGDEHLTEQSSKTEISDMFIGVKFCNGCTLELRSCKIGKNDYLRERLAKQTGCSIVLYKWYVTIFGWFR